MKYQPTPAEEQSGVDRVRWAEGLIQQLPADHDGRNSWLLNYGTSHEAIEKRIARGLVFRSDTQAAETSNQREARVNER